MRIAPCLIVLFVALACGVPNSTRHPFETETDADELGFEGHDELVAGENVDNSSQETSLPDTALDSFYDLVGDIADGEVEAKADDGEPEAKSDVVADTAGASDEHGTLEGISPETWVVQPCDSQCTLALCIETPDGLVCSKTCTTTSECPLNWVCRQSNGSGICVHPTPRQCLPCVTASDCESPQAVTPMKCARLGDRWFCLPTCTGDCQNSSECKTAETLDSLELVCVPKSGQCSCTKLAEGHLGRCLGGASGLCLGTFQCLNQEVTICSPVAQDEICNGLDDDCDGLVDEEVPSQTCVTENQFGRCEGTTTCVAGKNVCTAPEPAEEVCNGLDDNCNGNVDEGLSPQPCWNTNQAGSCQGTLVCMDGQSWCEGQIPVQEICNGADDDCDGKTDEGLGGQPCTTDAGCNGVTSCEGGKLVCVAASASIEVCNGKDDDCNGETDEDADDCVDFFLDEDRDGFGTTSRCLCAPLAPWDASKPLDCDDHNPSVRPWATEVCNGKDDDCDGETDEGLKSEPCKISNEYGTCTGVTTCTGGNLLCSALEPGPEVCNSKDDDCNGLVDDLAQTETCELTNQFGTCMGSLTCIGGVEFCQGVWPAPEACNGKDDDCDGRVDEGPADGCTWWFVDKDGDGYGGTVQCLCSKPQGAVALGGDCDDEDKTIYPGALERCDGKDQDCDGLVDEIPAIDCNTYLRDEDSDGFGLDGNTMCLCAPDPPYTATVGNDCNDLAAKIHPGAPEECNNRDDDCNGVTDDSDTVLCDDNDPMTEDLCLSGSERCLHRGPSVLVPAGDFDMGCNSQIDNHCELNEYPCHAVTVRSFRIDETEVTVSAYIGCVAAGYCTLPGDHSSCTLVSGTAQSPITCVDWYQATTYCNWTGGRLCTEAEWEKAARGTDGRVYPWGSTPASCDLAVLGIGGWGCGTGMPATVGSRPQGASPYGALDLVGNVAEWVQDSYQESYNGAPTDGSAWEKGNLSVRVVRGGSFVVQGPAARTSTRVGINADVRSFDLGFRCCRAP